MGYSSYSHSSRLVRATSAGYSTKSRDDIFQQNRLRRVHDSMSPFNVKVRESRDSIEHPETTPVQIYLDVTGSMGQLPHEMIKDGLPTLIKYLLDAGVPDVALMFGAVGDHACDSAPLQIGQFESGDAELDMWLERSWLEGGGGGNFGESYLLAWYFAGYHTSTDAFEKRGKKGFLFTVGDEPCLPAVPFTALKDIMGDSTALVGHGSATAEDLLKKAQETCEVFHIHINHHGEGAYRLDQGWVSLLGDHVVEIDDYKKVPETIASLILGKKINLSADIDQAVKDAGYDSTTPIS